MDQKSEISSRSYWDKTWARFLKHHGMIAPSAKLIQHMIPYVQRNGSILDLGCGEGRNTIYLSRIGYLGVGLDLSPKAVKVLANNLFEEEVKALCVVGDARNLPFRAEKFDGVLAHHIFDHLDENGFDQAIKNTFRILKKNGILLMTLDNFPKGMTDKNVSVLDDGAMVFVSGPYKGMLVRPYNERELRSLNEKGWKIIKDELTPRRSKIMLLQKEEVVHKS